MTEQTAGQKLTAEIRRYFSIGTRTRRYRKSENVAEHIIKSLQYATIYPGYFCEPTQTTFRSGYTVVCAYAKHVDGYRINPTKIAAIKAMSPWRFAAFLGEMLDSGFTNMGEAEDFFAKWEVAA